MAVTITSRVPTFAGGETTTGTLTLIAPNIVGGTFPIPIGSVDGLTAALDAKLEVSGDTMTGDLLFTDPAQLLIGFGTAAAPGLAFNGDPDTGIWWPTGNTIAIATGGTNRMMVESDGTLSVLTAGYEALVTADNDIPNKKFVDDAIAAITFGPFLELDGSTPMTGNLDMGTNRIVEVVDPIDPQDAATKNYVDTEIVALNLNGTGPYLRLDGSDVMAGTLDLDGNTIVLDADGDTTFAAGVDDTATLTLGGTGTVTFTPTTVSFGALDISGSGTVTLSGSVSVADLTVTSGTLTLQAGTALAPSLVFTGDPDTGLFTGGADTLSVATGGIERVRVSDATTLVVNDLDLDGKLDLVAGTATTPTVFFGGDTDTGFFWPGADMLGFSTAGTERLRIEANGTLSVAGTTNYETLVIDDDDIPNRKFVVDRIAADIAATTHISNVIEDTTPQLGGTLDVNGFTITNAAGTDVIVDDVLVATQDNATAFRLRGASAAGDPSAGADVQSFAGIFHNDPVFGGTSSSGLHTRAIFGANIEMDLEVQGPRQVRITAVDDTQVDGQLRVASRTNTTIHSRTIAEADSTKWIVFDRVDESNSTPPSGPFNTTDVTIESSTGNLVLWPGRKGADATAVIDARTDITLNGNSVVDVANPVDPQDAATKDYVDTEIVALSLNGTGPYLRLSGADTMAGDLLMGGGAQVLADDGSAGAPAYSFGSTTDLGIWTDTNALRFATESTDRMVVSSTIDMQSNRVTSVATPTASTDAANKAYVDAQNAVSVLGSATLSSAGGNSFLTAATTPIYTVPSGEMHIITDIIIKTDAYTPGASPTNPVIDVGLASGSGAEILDDVTVDFGGTAGAGDQAFYAFTQTGTPQPKIGTPTPNAGETVRITVVTPAGGTFSAFDGTIFILGIKL